MSAKNAAASFFESTCGAVFTSTAQKAINVSSSFFQCLLVAQLTMLPLTLKHRTAKFVSDSALQARSSTIAMSKATRVW